MTKTTISIQKILFHLIDNFILYFNFIYKLIKLITHIKMSYHRILTIITSSLLYRIFIIKYTWKLYLYI